MPNSTETIFSNQLLDVPLLHQDTILQHHYYQHLFEPIVLLHQQKNFRVYPTK
jgi:hypothetical protein